MDWGIIPSTWAPGDGSSRPARWHDWSKLLEKFFRNAGWDREWIAPAWWSVGIVKYRSVNEDIYVYIKAVLFHNEALTVLAVEQRIILRSLMDRVNIDGVLLITLVACVREELLNRERRPLYNSKFIPCRLVYLVNCVSSWYMMNA